MILKGKKIANDYKFMPGEFGTYPKVILANKNLTAMDKLILIAFMSYGKNYILAYTRLAKDIGCNKSHLIDRWKILKNKKYIIETETTYDINLDKIKEENKTNIGSLNLPQKNEAVESSINIWPQDGLPKHTQHGMPTIPIHGMPTIPNGLPEHTLVGMPTILNDYINDNKNENKEKDNNQDNSHKGKDIFEDLVSETHKEFSPEEFSYLQDIF